MRRSLAATLRRCLILRGNVNLVLFWLWLLGLLLFAWVIGQLPFATISETVASLTTGQWLAWLIVNLLVVMTAVGRWQLFNRLLKLQVSFSELLQIRQAGQAVSFITPGPQIGGEPLQLYWLHRLHRAPLPESVIALTLDRCYEVGVNASVLLSAISLLLFSPATPANNWLAIFIAVTVALATACMAVKAMIKPSQHLSRSQQALTPPTRPQTDFHTLTRYYTDFTSSISLLAHTQKPALWQALALSVASWAGLLAELWLLMEIVGAPTDCWSFLLLLVTMRVSFLLPLPGGIGTLEAAVLWTFDTLDSPAAAAMAMIALMRLRDGVLLTCGYCCLAALSSRQNAEPNQRSR